MLGCRFAPLAAALWDSGSISSPGVVLVCIGVHLMGCDAAGCDQSRYVRVAFAMQRPPVRAGWTVPPGVTQVCRISVNHMGCDTDGYVMFGCVGTTNGLICICDGRLLIFCFCVLPWYAPRTNVMVP